MALIPQDTIDKILQKTGMKNSQDISISAEEIENFGDEDSMRKIFENMAAYKRMLNEKITFITPALTDKIPFTRENLYLICAYSGQGKCFSPGTKVLMFDGTVKKVEDVLVGDQVMGPDSKPRNVLNLSSGVDEMYDVIPVKGEKYTVNSKHILSMKFTQSRVFYKGIKQGDIVNIPVLDYMNANSAKQIALKGWRTGVDFDDSSVDLDPYFLGLWLGDGTSSNTGVTTMDTEIVDFLQEISIEQGLFLKERSKTLKKVVNKSSTYMFSSGRRGGDHQDKAIRNNMLVLLRKYNLVNNKHIPRDYLINSKEIRLQVLAGLIDSDGYLDTGVIDICFKNQQLANDTVFLARSLGLAAYIHKVNKTCTNSPTKATGEYYRISISGHLDMIPTKLKRKQAASRKQIKDVLHVGLTIKHVGIGQYFGFEVDGDHLFLLGDFTVTHNSTISANIAYSLCKENKKLLIISNEESEQDILMRIACIDEGVSFNDFKKGTMPQHIILNCSLRFAEITKYVKIIDVNYRNGITTYSEGVKNILESIKDKDYSCAMIDYWQLIKRSNDNPAAKTYDVLNDLRVWLGQYIKRANLPIVMFAQLHSIGKRQNKDLDSRIKHCPDIYEPATVVIEAIPNWENKTTEFHIHKDRFGLAGSNILLAFDKGRFIDASQETLRRIQENKAQELNDKIDSVIGSAV